MAFTSQPNFMSVLDGTDVNELNKRIDYTKTHLEERKEVVEEILNSTNFYEEYFDSYFKASINSGDPLSKDVNVCKSLERMANYLLNSKEVKQAEDAEKVKYVFHTDRRYFQKKVNREHSIGQMMDVDNDDYEENVIHFLKTSEPNHRKSKSQTTDLRNIKVSKVNSEEHVEKVKGIVKEYQSFVDYITEKLVNKDRSVNRYLLTKTKGELNDDIVLTKDFLLGVWGYNLKNLSESNKPDMNRFDFTNIHHVKGREVAFINNKGKESVINVKGLMYFNPYLDPSDELSFTLYDFEQTVKKANLTEEEKFVLSSIRQGLTQEETARELDTYQKKISRTIDIIAKKIIKVGNKYDLEGMAD